jgi:sulfoxide reductase heme-binding subunit YedZ
MSRRARIALKTGVWAVGLAPLGALLYWVLTDDLTANPISFITNHLGIWTFRILLSALAVTPLRILTGWGWPPLLRRLLGLFAFFYVSLHFSVWILIDHFFNWGQMAADVVKRPYVTMGMTTLTLLLPLAATSTAGMVKRLGAVRWKRLHRLVYLAGIAAALHFLWLAKVGRTEPYYYAAVLAVLLGVRAVDALRRLARRRRLTAPAAAPSTVPRP